MPRPRKPTAVLHLNGAFKKNPDRAAARTGEPKFEKGIGEPPEWLDALAVEEWWRVVPDLEKAGVTCRVEAAALGCYCQAVSRLRAAEAQIARDGITIVTPVGLRKHPAVTVADRAMVLVRSFAMDFGITPASRSRVAVAPADKLKDNEFAAV